MSIFAHYARYYDLLYQDKDYATEAACVHGLIQHHVFVTRKSDGVTEELHEPHVMRYLFTPEVNLFLTQAGLKGLGGMEWMTGQAPETNTWSVLYLAQNSQTA